MYLWKAGERDSPVIIQCKNTYFAKGKLGKCVWVYEREREKWVREMGEIEMKDNMQDTGKDWCHRAQAQSFSLVNPNFLCFNYNLKSMTCGVLYMT